MGGATRRWRRDGLATRILSRGSTVPEEPGLEHVPRDTGHVDREELVFGAVRAGMDRARHTSSRLYFFSGGVVP